MPDRYPLVTNGSTVQEIQSADALLVVDVTETVFTANSGSAITLSDANGRPKTLRWTKLWD